MPTDENSHLRDIQLAKLFHDLLLSYMHFTMGIVPNSRLKKITSYLNETMYYFMDFKLLGLIEFNDPMKTIERYHVFLQKNKLAEKLTMISTKENNCITWRFNVIKCIFGNSCRNIHDERYICPVALFGGFLIQESCSGYIRVDSSTNTFHGCETIICLYYEPLVSHMMRIKGW